MRASSRRSILLVSCTLAGVFVGTSAVSAAHRSRSTPTVTATLSEMHIAISPTRVHAGKVTFVARNVGSVEHELIVVALPRGGKLRVGHFRADESASLGEVPELRPGKTGSVTLMLRPGRYALFCNVPGHYQLGMHTVLEAEAAS